jgi:hypothetical protein
MSPKQAQSAEEVEKLTPAEYMKRSEAQVATIIKAALQRASDDPRGETAFKLIEYFRKECQFEMNLIGMRITWLLGVQAFLVTASVFAVVNSLNPTFGKVRAALDILSCGICVIGVIICDKTLDAVDRAKCTVDAWHTRMRELFEYAPKGTDLGTLPWASMLLLIFA